MSKQDIHTTLYVIRHGETVNADPKRYKGTIDVPLSANGITQMAMSAAYLEKIVLERNPGTGLAAVYTSDLSRAWQSAEILAERLKLKPIAHQSLRERHFGRWEGMSFDEITEQYPVEFQAWKKNPLLSSPVDGESTAQVKRRVIPAVDEIIQEYRNKQVALVAHGGVNRVILCHYLGIPLEHIFRIEQGNGAISIIEFRDEYPLLSVLNRTP
jgi:alpha-ribazole phosphatase/probable phosphoglycerate mutase